MLQSAAMKRFLVFVLLILLSPFLAAQVAAEVEITAEPSHHLVVENEFVRAFKVEVEPHTATLMHRHRHDYVYVTLGDAHVSNEVEGKPSVDVKLADGDTRFVSGDFAHVAKNVSDQSFRNVTVELMKDEKMRSVPSRWSEHEKDGKDETIFPGGRIKVLFLKDGSRVSEVTLDPDGAVPSHHHDGPHLLIAVTDLNLRSDIEDGESIAAKSNAGDVKWLPGGYTHTLTNVGKNPARFVTVEF
jgi:quercetin dioxygenase-like cupin family protein